MFNRLEVAIDYTINQQVRITSEIRNKYMKYANRDYRLISNELKDIGTILEIGGGYGFLSDLIVSEHGNIKYVHFELNFELRRMHESNGYRIIETLEPSLCPDLIIMGHCLEHIPDAPEYIKNLLTIYPCAKIILFQTNPEGFIPKYLPWFWYGWSFDQHYYHFSIKSLKCLMEQIGMELASLKYYKLHQEPSFSPKGAVKLSLMLLNIFITNERSDAYMVKFKRRICS